MGTEAFHLPVDFSRVGVYRVTVRESHPDASYRDFYLRTDPKFHSSGDLSDAMRGGRAVLRVTDEGGKELFSQDVQGVSRGPAREYVLADRVLTHGVGRYAVEVNVTEGAAGLAGRKQEVVGVYEYWSEDMIPAALVIMAAVGCWMAAGAGAIVTLARARRGAAHHTR